MDGSLLRNTWASLLVINVGFLLSSLVAVPLGILMGSFRVVAAALEPIVNFTRYLPVTSMIPLLILWIGIGFQEKVAVIFIGTFFQQIVMVSDVSARVPSELFNASYTLGASKWQVVTRVLLPATMPGVMDTLRVTMGWAWTYLVVAELVASSSGLGYMSMQAMRGLHADYIFVGILVIGFWAWSPIRSSNGSRSFACLGQSNAEENGIMGALDIENVGLRFGTPGDEVVALSNLHMRIPDKQFAVIVGPSGCGKSSLLDLVAGLKETSSGVCKVNGRVVVRSRCRPGHGVSELLAVSLAFGAEECRIRSRPPQPASARKNRAGATFRAMPLASAISRMPIPAIFPAAMKQRVAIARALANDPGGPADGRALRRFGQPNPRGDAGAADQDLGATSEDRSFVTHDIDEAIFLGDVVYVMSARPGRIIDTIDVDLARPRQYELVTTPAFIDLKRRIQKNLHHEVHKALGISGAA